MKDKIQFRGQAKTNGAIVYGYYVFCRGRHYILQDYNANGYDERWDTSDWVEVLPETVGQLHNGLSKKADTDIYVGDKINYDLREGMGEPYSPGYKGDIYSIEGNYTYYTNVSKIIPLSTPPSHTPGEAA